MADSSGRRRVILHMHGQDLGITIRAAVIHLQAEVNRHAGALTSLDMVQRLVQINGIAGLKLCTNLLNGAHLHLDDILAIHQVAIGIHGCRITRDHSRHVTIPVNLLATRRVASHRARELETQVRQRRIGIRELHAACGNRSAGAVRRHTIRNTGRQAFLGDRGGSHGFGSPDRRRGLAGQGDSQTGSRGIAIAIHQLQWQVKAQVLLSQFGGNELGELEFLARVYILHLQAVITICREDGDAGGRINIANLHSTIGLQDNLVRIGTNCIGCQLSGRRDELGSGSVVGNHDTGNRLLGRRSCCILATAGHVIGSQRNGHIARVSSVLGHQAETGTLCHVVFLEPEILVGIAYSLKIHNIVDAHGLGAIHIRVMNTAYPGRRINISRRFRRQQQILAVCQCKVVVTVPVSLTTLEGISRCSVVHVDSHIHWLQHLHGVCRCFGIQRDVKYCLVKIAGGSIVPGDTLQRLAISAHDIMDGCATRCHRRLGCTLRFLASCYIELHRAAIGTIVQRKSLVRGIQGEGV